MKIIPEGSTEYIVSKALLNEALSDSIILPDYVKEHTIVKVSTTEHRGYAIIEHGSRFFKCWYTKMNIDLIPPTLESVEEVEPKEETTVKYV